MQNANLKFWSKPKILPKPKIFAKQEFYSPLACKHLCWPQLGRSAKKFIGLTLKCQIEEVPLLSLGDKNRPIHWTKTAPFLLCYVKPPPPPMLSKNVGKFKYLNRKFKCKMQMQIAIAKGKPKIFYRTQNFAQT